MSTTLKNHPQWLINPNIYVTFFSLCHAGVRILRDCHKLSWPQCDTDNLHSRCQVTVSMQPENFRSLGLMNVKTTPCGMV